MRTILNFDDGLDTGPVRPQASGARINEVRVSGGLFLSADATAEGAWGRWGGSVVAATVAHVVALAVGLTLAGREPPARVKPSEPELVLMAYAPPPPPLGGGTQARQARSEPVKPLARRPRPVKQELMVPVKVLEPVKEEVPATPEEVAPDPSPAVADAPVGPGVPQGVVGGVEGGTVGGLAGGRVGGLGAAPAIFSPREVMKLPVLLDGKPDYPRRAREDGITGVVMVYVVIGADGRVEPAYTRIQRSVPGLDEAAIESVSRWRFSPALGHDGRPVRVKVVIPVKFALK
ncbi:TonB family protein [Corallococcus sp. bb12-1]|uniref:energy transducer TonB n=1 Tax=Corallococcus sp. bb12-1 TaxID=2996784 RepID=UPI00226D9EC4|nr:energy transducer TonB [Corallococcus sp. bb12-1]MCY1047421.1 TonB family protein [Corallococcus sp. bb12-1]